MHSVQESFSEARVPAGMQFMSVVASLSTVQIVFMNMFMVEFLDYLAGRRAGGCQGGGQSWSASMPWSGCAQRIMVVLRCMPSTLHRCDGVVKLYAVHMRL
eukprot:GHRQ01023880.1.p2 GENE.GHRQ01023880.1~~GHRQ01023880.1.p2  ORF type:complete len:101 (-),score=13.45 GHRQ01023880.1:37-339(-)